MSSLPEARKLLGRGRPHAALNAVTQFGDGPSAQKESEYWQVRALALYMCGKIVSAKASLRKSGGPTEAFYKDFLVAIQALAEQRQPRLWWNIEKRELVLYSTAKEALSLADKLGLSVEETSRHLSTFLPRSLVK